LRTIAFFILILRRATRPVSKDEEGRKARLVLHPHPEEGRKARLEG
jgi:hypothetical protein